MIGSWALPLLAQVYREDLGRGFRGATSQLRWTDVIPYVLAIALIIGGTALYSYMKRRNDMTEKCNDPHKLFRELCLAHQLDHGHRRLLLQLATALDWAHPAELFVSPWVFEGPRVPSALRTRIDDLKQLRARIF